MPVAVSRPSSPPVSPPINESVTIVPGLVDFHASHNPRHPWAILASDSATPAPSISFLEFAEATHRVAHILRPRREGPDNEVVALLINCDTVVYLALIAGMIRAGLIPFPMSPRNSAPAVTSFLKRTSCHRMICQSSTGTLWSSVQRELRTEGFALEIEELPDIASIYPNLCGNSSTPLPTPYPSGEKLGMDDIAFYIHSSGSTGFPKPIPQRFIHMLETSKCSILADSRKRGVFWGPMALPTFHVMGIYMQLYGPLSSGLPIALFAPRAPSSPIVPTAKLTLQACKMLGCTGIPTVPAFVETWAKVNADIESLRSLRIIAYAGGPLSAKTGSVLNAAGVSLCPWYGATEFGPPTRIFDIDESGRAGPTSKLKSDWEWMTFTDHVNIRWVPEGDGTYELQFLTCRTHHPCIENLPDCRGYATNDLFQPHPTKSGLWRVTGRKDDVIVLGSGEKVVPIPQEGLIGTSRMIAGAVMFGRGKSQCGLLIEPSQEYATGNDGFISLPKFRNAIWPIVDEANGIAPAFGRIFKEMIIVTDDARPLPRAAKGTIMRKQALSMYEKEINELYHSVENSEGSGGIAPPRSWSPSHVEPWLTSHASAVLGGKHISPTVDLFDQGFDSLYATFLRNRIVGALRFSSGMTQAAQIVSQNFVFENPTVHELALAVAGLVFGGAAKCSQNTEQQISEMIERFTSNLPASVPAPARNGCPKRIVVLLTGSTGNVGSQLLATLIGDTMAAKVFTLNRESPKNYDRQQVAFQERGLDPWLLEDPRLTQLVGDLNKKYFGLTREMFNEVQGAVTHVLHNAWRVDFNLSLPSFESHVAGTRKLVDFCGLAPRPVKLLFTSSISASRRWDVVAGPVPEEPLPKADVATANGYGASKYVAEQILMRAANNGLQCTSLRLGQVCGSQSTGAWSTTEWFPILVKSSQALELFPDLEGLVSWVPADAVANTFINLVMSEAPLPPVLNLVHPRPVTWRVICKSLNKHLAHRPLKTVPFSEWLNHIERLPVRSDIAGQVPAIKLLDYFRGLAEGERRTSQVSVFAPVEAGCQPVFSTERMRQLSSSLRNLDALEERHAEAWVKYWKEIGFIH